MFYYNPQFLGGISSQKGFWNSLMIQTVAHELGGHMYQDMFDHANYVHFSGGNNPHVELPAYKIGYGVLDRLNASGYQTTLNGMSLERGLFSRSDADTAPWGIQ